MSKVSQNGFKPGGFAFYDIDSLEISQWCRDDEAKLPPEQVHMQINVKGSKTPFVMRFKSPETIGFLIEQLAQHRREVWPDAPLLRIKQ